MEPYTAFIPGDEFAGFIEKLPEACVEVVLRTERGVLLAKRTNEPAKGEWFWPGSRLYKGEGLQTAAKRVAREELGIQVSVEEQLGTHGHFWETSALPGGPSRHTVNVVYLVEPVVEDPDIALNEEHSEYRFETEAREDDHEYVRRYFREHELP
ncbi:MAG: NUDIX domain-containing protein [Halodesulfurarchaeum sp.]